MARQAKSPRRRCFVEEIEPRVLYSADFAPLDVGTAALLSDSEHRVLDANGEFAGDSTGDAKLRLRELVFVDGNTPDWQWLVDALQDSDERAIEVVVLDPDRDGVQQISAALAGRSGLDAVHIFCHGEPGALQLGSTRLDFDSLPDQAGEIRSWGDALGAQGDLLIYGCDVAGSEEGRSLLESLARLTGADVAASVDPTGNSALGGDWDLEFATAAIETQGMATAAIQEGWLGLLDLSTLQAAQDTYIMFKPPDDVNNFGASTSIVLDRQDSDVQRILLQFDLSGIPVGSTINGATLKLQSTQIDGNLNIGVYEVAEAWDEGAGNGTAGTANWNQRQSGTSWATAGGTFDPTAVALINTSSTGQHVWDVTSLVQGWVGGAKVNNGLMVASPDGGGNRTATYDSREGATAPVLEIDYTPPVNTAPALDASKSPALSPVAEDAGMPSGAVGTLISQLVDFASPSGQLDNVIDPDPGAQLGVAITGADATNGSWWYSTDGGAGWNALGAVSDANARLLAADAGSRIYFQPNPDFNGSIATALTFRAWDGTSGVAGGTAATTADLSVRDNFNVVSYANNDGTATWSAGWVDSDANPSAGNVRVTGGQLVLSTFLGSDSIYREVDLSAAIGATLSFAFDNQLGALGAVSLQVSANGGGSYSTLATFSNTANTGTGTYTADLTPYAAANTRLRLVMNGTLLGGSFRADDLEIAFTELRTGGSFALSSSSDTAGLVVTSVNDAPVIVSNGGGPTASLGIAENAATVTTVTATDVDVPAQLLTYSIVGGADQARFSIDGSTGLLSFVAPPDYELPTDADADNVYHVTVEVTDGNGGADAQDIAVTVTQVDEAGVLAISGTVSEDETLTATPGDPDGLSGTVSYQWQRSADGVIWSSIGGATGGTYILGDADVGMQIRVQASYTDDQGSAENVTSAATAAVANVNDAPVGVPTIVGTVTEGQTLTAGTAGITDADGLGAFSYQWLRDGAAIAGATAATYTLDDADVGARISVQVIYTDAHGSGEGPLTSAQTAPLANVNDAPLGAPAIIGTAAEGQTLTADTSGIGDADGLGPFSYQWLRDGVTIAGATGSTYLLGGADIGGQISVQVTYTDAHGMSEGPLTSAQTAAVANVNDAPVAVALSNATLSDGTDTSTGYSVGSLSTTDADAGDVHTYSIVGGADAPRFSVSAGQLILTDGVLRFASQPSYQVTVRSTDVGGLYVDVTFTISIDPPNPTPMPAPVEATPSAPPILPGPGPAESIDPLPGAGSPPASDASEESDTDDETGSESVDAPAASAPQSTDAAEDTADRSATAPVRALRGLSRLVSGGGSPGASARLTGGGGTGSIPSPAATEALLQTENQMPVPGAAPNIALEQFRASLASRGWLDAVDQMRERFDKPLHAQQMLVGSSVAVGGGLSVGYIMWLLRGGLLLSSLISSLPAWQSIDPLPVLGQREDEEGDSAEDSDPLERIFGRAKEALVGIATGKPAAASGMQSATASPLRGTHPATV